MTTTIETSFDFDRLKRAMEGAVAQDIAGLYAENAELVIVDQERQPRAPMRLNGRSAIAGYWRDVCGRGMSHAVSREVVGTDRAAFVEECVYPDGCHVMSSNSLDLADGRIRRHLVVQAWDDMSGKPAAA
jgi:hypothetical protein